MTVSLMPKRIQRKRSKGWKMPANAVYVGRPTRYGNPFFVRDFAGGKKACVAFFRDHIRALDLETGGEITRVARAELGGKDLVCWCPLDQPCHADVLLEVANDNSLAL